MAEDKPKSPDPMWADRLAPEGVPDGVEEEEEEPTPPEQGLPEH